MLVKTWEKGHGYNWRVELHKRNRYGEDYMYIITVNNATGWNDNPIRYNDGRIAYDFPECIPQYAKELTAKAFNEVHGKE